MRRKALWFLAVFLVVFLTACSNGGASSRIPEKGGVSPCELSETETQLLESFDMTDTAQLMGFRAPEDAVSMKINVYHLKDGAWQSAGQGEISTGKGDGGDKALTGTIAMQILEDHRIKFTVHSSGNYTFISDAILSETESQSSMTGFLQGFQSGELNTEIPVALMVHDAGTKMSPYSLADYFDPTRFAEMDFVQVVTVEFSEK